MEPSMQLAQVEEPSYERIDFSAPLDVAAYARALPAGALARGMFFSSVIATTERLSGKRPNVPDYVHFKEYPILDFFTLVAKCAPLAFHGTPMREALRRFGQDVFPMLSQTMIGKTIFGVAMRDWPRTLDLASRGYPVSIRPGSARLLELHPRSAIISLRDVWSYPDCYQVGIFEGAMRMFKLQGTIKVRRFSLCDVDLAIEWL
jgi:uncharacterized protein (TIGR02265 family)